MVKKSVCACLVTGSLLALAVPASAAAGGWQSVGDSKTTGVSGMVLTANGPSGIDTLIVRDNKKSGQNRVASLHLATGQKPVVTELDWDGTLPSDLEAIDAVPGKAGEYVALASAGKGYAIQVTAGKATVLGTFTLPGVSDDPNYEGFALASLSGEVVAVWADRGADSTPAVVSAATFDTTKFSFGTAVNMNFTAPYPTSDVRNVSDVKIGAGGGLLVSSASDAGDSGPFNAAVYNAGSVATTSTGVSLTPVSSPQPLLKFAGHKVEGIVCLPGSTQGVVGSDDEDLGGSVETATFCTP